MTAPNNLERAASILAFVAVRLLQLKEALCISIYLKKKGLTKEAEIHEKTKCDKVLEGDEWKLLLHLNPQRGVKKGSVPSLQWAYLSIAKLGGFNDTKRTGIASCPTIWEGWSILQNMLVGYRIAKEC